MSWRISPDVTLSAFTETGREESTIPVLQQRSFTGKMVIPSALANTPCADLGIMGVLEKLNTTVGTSYTLDRYPVLNSFLDSCIERNYDLGTAYAHIRYCLFFNRIAAIKDDLPECEVKDRKMRQAVLCNDGINMKEVPPRRVWDLRANRVVPYWVTVIVTYKPLLGISHAWMDEKDRVDVWTPINGYQWPVPMPKDADLNLIRMEMLNTGARYAWLDVLCLRQKYSPREDYLEEDRLREKHRVEEWKLDVPTIGYVYDNARVVYYLSGLGRPLSLTPGCFNSDRCWFNRAWTLQEISDYYTKIIGGDTGDDSVRMTFDEQLESLQRMSSVGDILFQMQKRVSTNPIDRVAGLVYRLDPPYIPIYDAERSEESAWVELVNAMKYSSRVQLFFCYPEPGNGSKCWRPSWTQVMDATHLGYLVSVARIDRMEETDLDWYKGGYIDSAYVRGLADTSNQEQPRRGELVVTDHTGLPHTFETFAEHKYPIPDDSYTLLLADPPNDTHGVVTFCVVGQWGQDGKFQKLSVISFVGYIWRKYEQELNQLGILKHNVEMILC